MIHDMVRHYLNRDGLESNQPYTYTVSASEQLHEAARKLRSPASVFTRIYEATISFYTITAAIWLVDHDRREL